MAAGISALGWAGIIGGGLSLAGSLVNSDASQSAAQTQAQGQASNAALQQSMFNTINGQQAPWRQAGYQALNTIFPGGDPNAQKLGPDLNSYFLHQFDKNDLNANLAPNYDFQLQQGLGAVRNQLNTQGGAVSGNLLKGINDYAQNYAGNAYQQAFQNYTANQSNIFNRLASIAQLGQTANQATATAGTALGANIGNAYGNAATAQAAGQIGSGNAISGGLGNAASWYALPALLGNNNSPGTIANSGSNTTAVDHSLEV